MTEKTNAELDEEVIEQDDAAEAVAKLEKPKQPKQADILIELAQAAVLFHTPAGTSYADLDINGHRETWPVRSTGFKRWLVRRFYETQKGAPNSEALGSALNVIDAKAQIDGEECPVYLRVGGVDDKLYIDLCDDTWRAVEVDATGWQVVDDPPVRFRRASGMLPLPEPESGGTVDLLRPFLNVSCHDDFVLAVSWLLAALHNRGPYPVLVLAGEQGSAKSTFSAILRALVDPNTTPLRSLPREDRDLFIAATNGHVLSFDNVSGLTPWISDSLCRLATGGGFAVRKLYSDGDEVLFHETRPSILNGIEDIVGRPDLADRAIFLTLTPIPEEQRRPERELWAAFEQDRPAILGALLDAIVEGIERRREIRLAKLPRMADFALVAIACETAIWPAGTFMAAYDGNRADAVTTVIEADPVATAVRDLMATHLTWTGTASTLLSVLSGIAGERAANAKTWPADGPRLGGRLRRAATFLRKTGIDIDFGRGNRERAITIKKTAVERVGNSPSLLSPLSPRSSNGSKMPLAPDPHDSSDSSDSKKPTHSNGHTCRQCGLADGHEQEFSIDGETVWLHRECTHFWLEGDGWGVRR
jgi:hypothetical protein